MGQTNSYDFKDVQIIINGAIVLDGFGEGEVTIAMDEDEVGDTVGLDGEAAIWASNNKKGSITFPSLQTSRMNTILQGFVNLNRARFGAGFFSVMVKNKRTGTKDYSPVAYVTKSADNTHSKEAGSREWVIRTPNLTMDDTSVL